MNSFQELITRYRPGYGVVSVETGTVHATLAAFPDRIGQLELVVASLLGQVDTFHIFLTDFSEIPSFLDHPKIYLSRSQDFGNLGECGKYYWTDDLQGYHFICSDKMIYPGDYVEKMKAEIETRYRKAVVAAGGYLLDQPFHSLEASSRYLDETSYLVEDMPVPLVNDLALAYHTDTIRVSRHFFYQPEFSGIWFSIVAQEQQVPLVCLRHEAGWLQCTDPSPVIKPADDQTIDYRAFLVRSNFTDKEEKRSANPFNVNNYFDRIYVMNLDRRPDRWEKIRRIAERHKLDITRFPAVDGFMEPVKSQWENYAASPLKTLPEGIEPLTDYRDKFLKYHHYIARIQFMESKLNRKAVQSPGALGYALSYISILKEAIRNNFNRILIFDDDIVLHKKFNEEFEKHVQQLPSDWKLFMLGAMQHRWEPYITMYRDMFYHCHGSSVASHAVGIDRKVFLPLLFYSEKLDLPVDEGAIFHIQNVYDKNCYIFLPNLAIQDMTESDISSSAMKKEDTVNWINKFRWKTEDYDL